MEPTHFTGTVHSVFQRCCNLRLGSGLLLTLLASECGNQPHGVRLNSRKDFAFTGYVCVGDLVACRGGVVRIGAGRFSADLRTSIPWAVNLLKLRADLNVPGSAMAWRTAWRLLMDICDKTVGSGLHPAVGCGLPGRTIGLLGTLMKSTRAYRVEETGSALLSLIGAGPGLTPAGDDFTVGYLAGLWSIAGVTPARHRFVYSLKPRVLRAVGMTNEISGSFIHHAGAGQVGEPLAHLATCIAQAASAPVVEAAMRLLLRIGHTSGADAGLGLLIALGAWGPAGLHNEIWRDCSDLSNVGLWKELG